ncbi:hypothetical protein Ppa06_38590 [Planomonospora parontospora subsp. parontospora]|uniref:Uncharacterized protein n=2 Tax=Planomonospora parontospora TaxID=58119 RepID=A0AA37BIQ4_9ACTN|nr:hypothetical protein GCM10010126_40320 [Planomonospora parontospora]GII10061.1 hypothetical protein Ppa06_38590 [Planomonospora parontospora subsp. parontospora]
MPLPPCSPACTRYAAACLLAGYGWPAVTGAPWAATGPAAGEYLYDAALHALFLGFVVSMVFACSRTRR